MEEWKIRFIKEFWELKEKVWKLRVMLVKHEANCLEFEPKTPIDILVEQYETMEHYLDCLIVRANIEKIDLNADISEGELK